MENKVCLMNEDTGIYELALVYTEVLQIIRNIFAILVISCDTYYCSQLWPIIGLYISSLGLHDCDYWT